MSINAIKDNLYKLDITYPPCEYISTRCFEGGRMSVIGPIGTMEPLGAKYGSNPLRKSICLTLKLKRSYYRNHDLLDTIYNLMEGDIQGDEVILSKIGDHGKYEKLMLEYNGWDYRVYTSLPIKIIPLDDIQHMKKSATKLEKVIHYKTSMDELEEKIKSCEPCVKLYCRSGTTMYELIERELYDLIKY